jgi:predicted component of type VI protein secretion system
MTQNKTDLTSLNALQASRLKLAAFERALDQGHFDPYPDGTASTGPTEQRAVTSRRSGARPSQIGGAPLSSFDGALPDYILDAMLNGVHNDDDGLHAFLTIFDKRLKQLELRIRRAAVLVASKDKGRSTEASVLSRFARLCLNGDYNSRYIELVLPLLSRSRSLENLQAILSWWTGCPAQVSVHFKTRHSIRAESRTRISSRRNTTAQLGAGAILGQMGRTPAGHIEVFLQCEGISDFQQLASDTEGLCALRHLITRYLRDPVPVTIYAQVQHDILHAPRLSSCHDKSSRLGAYNILCPGKQPEHSAKIKLTEISA